MINPDSRIVTNSSSLAANYQSINQSIKQASKQSINQSINESTNQSTTHSQWFCITSSSFLKFFTLTPKHLSTSITPIKPLSLSRTSFPHPPTTQSSTVGTSTIFSVISSKCRGTFPHHESGWIKERWPHLPSGKLTQLAGISLFILLSIGNTSSKTIRFSIAILGYRSV